MSTGAALLTLLLLLAVIVIVSGPLRAPRRRAARASDVGALEAAREAKYSDLREAELDFRTGKLSAADYEAIRARLRAEALEILNRLEAAGVRADAPAPETASDVQERDRVPEEEHREDDRPAVEVALDHRAAAERPGAAPNAERAGEARVLAGVHEHEQHEHDRD